MATRDVSAFGASLVLHVLGLGMVCVTCTPSPQLNPNRDHPVSTVFIAAAAPEDTTFADVDFVGFIRRYASEHPSTKATIELLFFLDKIAQANRSILGTLLETDPVTQLTWTRDTNRTAYDLVTEIRRHYADRLGRLGLLDSLKTMAAAYDKVRLTILSGILRTTPDGYRAGDAYFLMGTIYWKQRKEQEALRSWREIKGDQTDSYVVAYSEILDALRSTDEHPTLPDQRISQPHRLEIRRILDAERGRGRMFSLDRLRQFGYHVDTF